MTTNPHTKWTPRSTSPPPEPKKPKRWFMWTFLAVQTIFVLWVVLGIDAVKGAGEDCTGLDAQTCHDAATAGGVVGLGLVVGLWVAVDLILGITYAIVRYNRRRSS